MRLGHHLRDKHGASWDRFSVYLTIGDSHLRELEALILRIVKPRGNTQKGKFAKSEDLKVRFGRDVRHRHREAIDILLGITGTSSNGHTNVRTLGKTGALVKVLRGRAWRLRRTYKGKLYKAHLRKDGKVVHNKVIMDTVGSGKSDLWTCRKRLEVLVVRTSTERLGHAREDETLAAANQRFCVIVLTLHQ